jgi:hypothetical protein
MQFCIFDNKFYFSSIRLNYFNSGIFDTLMRYLIDMQQVEMI